MTVGAKRCVDCVADGIETYRKPYVVRGKTVPGNRCKTHYSAKKKQTSLANAEKRWEQVYSISADIYWAIYEAQGGLCALCRRANGKSKRLAVDHDHGCCPGKTSCGRCVRSLLCTTCNKMLGHLEDDPELVERIWLYLMNPPGKEVVREWGAR